MYSIKSIPIWFSGFPYILNNASDAEIHTQNASEMRDVKKQHYQLPKYNIIKFKFNVKLCRNW